MRWSLLKTLWLSCKDNEVTLGVRACLKRVDDPERVRVGSRWNSADSQQESAPTVRGELGLCHPVNISGSTLALTHTVLKLLLGFRE